MMDDVKTVTTETNRPPKAESNFPILFTAFEPSGDGLAAPVIAELLRRNPQRSIYALGGEKMQAAGAKLIENTCNKPVMLVGAAKQIFNHKTRVKRLAQWMQDNQPALIVPVDSPAANWSICKRARAIVPQSKIVHLAAPQIWAWAGWRINKLRKLTDKVLCLLSFEPDWFAQRRVPGVFVGHPVFSQHHKNNHLPRTQNHQDDLLLAVLPGSRSGEIKANWPGMVKAIQKLCNNNPQIRAVVFSANDTTTALLNSFSPGGKFPQWMKMEQAGNDSFDQLLSHADMALAVSGTITLECVARNLPLIAMYKINWWSWHLVGRWLIKSRTFTLPNLAAHGPWLKIAGNDKNKVNNASEIFNSPHVVPELVPWFGNIDSLKNALTALASSAEARDQQREAFKKINAVYSHCHFAQSASDEIEKTLAL